MKHEWRKHEKALYLPPRTPVFIQIPTLNFFTISGKGNPNDAFFKEYVQTLYALSYAVKMSPKKGDPPKGYYAYTVYPLEGVWDISEEAKRKGTAGFDKNELVFKLMIRQPEFVDAAFASRTIEVTKKKNPNPLLDEVKFEAVEDGACVQMLHLGSYDSEPKSFQEMEAFAASQKLKRISKVHREIYLSDARKVTPDKLKTVLRFKVEPED